MARTVALIGTIKHGETADVLPQSDRAAMTLATSGVDASSSAVTIGYDPTAARYARATGIPSARMLGDPDQLDFDVLLIGLGAMHRCGEWWAGWWAESRRAALVFDVLEIKWGNRLVGVVRDLERGNREVMSVSLPAVLVIASSAQAAYISRYRLLKADCEMSYEQVGGQASFDPLIACSGVWAPKRPRVRLSSNKQEGLSERLAAVFGVEQSLANTEPSQAIIRADPATCTQQFLRYLIHHKADAANCLFFVITPLPFSRHPIFGKRIGVTAATNPVFNRARANRNRRK